MNVLLTGGHEEHEYDFFKMFGRFGYSVSCPGTYGSRVGKRGYFDPETPTDKYTAMQRVYTSIHIEYPARYGHDHLAGIHKSPTLSEFVAFKCGKEIELLIKDYDFGYALLVTYASVFAPFIPTILHLNGQMSEDASPVVEFVLRCGGRVVAYSQNQASIYPNTDIPVIHFGKDPNEWCGWTGEEESVLYIANNITERKHACHYTTFLKTRIPDKWWLAGSDNDILGTRAIQFGFDSLKEQMRRSRCFFNLGTEPAPVTLGVIEAAMTGMPIITQMYQHGQGQPKYEVPSLLGEGCIVLESPNKEEVASLMSNRGLMSSTGAAARKSAMEVFAQSVVDYKWKSLIESWIKK